jgi:hypothetical protein
MIRPTPVLASLLPGLRLLASQSIGADSVPAAPQAVIQKVKEVEQSVGLQPTENFAHTAPGMRSYDRCYFTRVLELPESYARLKLRDGARDGCAPDPKKYDAFFYHIEAVASGNSPITRSLAEAAPERLLAVVSHEDFHAQVRDLPVTIAEAAATLAGFLIGAEADPRGIKSELYRDAEVFLEKSVLINRYHAQLSAVYKAVKVGALSNSSAMARKQSLLRNLQQECSTIRPDPLSFNKCVSAANNAGLAFNHTYTQYYPLLYQVLVACRYGLKCTVETITKAPKKTSEAAVVRYFEGFLEAPQEPSLNFHSD